MPDITSDPAVALPPPAGRTPLLMRLLGLLPGCAVLLAAAVVHADFDQPLSVRNTSPIAGLYGLPAWQCSGDGVGVRLEQGSNFTGSTRGVSQVILDGETTVAAFTVNQFAGQGWSWGLELPVVRHEGGFLDGFLEGYHDLFGLPDGGRGPAPRNRLLYAVDVPGQRGVTLTSSRTHMADMRFHVGRSLVQSGPHSLSLQTLLKLPTGTPRSISGSGAVDAGAWLQYQARGLDGSGRVSLSAMLGGTWLGRGDLVADRQSTFLPAGHFGLSLRIHERLRLLAQVDAHGALFDLAGLDVLNRPGVLGTIGGRLRLAGAVCLEASVVEDLVGRSASDVVFRLALLSGC
ncbi:MAG: DUF3187 family protein [Pseudomonadales bacterium]